MKVCMKWGIVLVVFALVNPLYSASIDFGGAVSDLNPTAIGMFLTFVLATLFITYLSNKKSQSASGFYTAGGNISGMQNGIAIAGDFMSAASFLGITALVFTNVFVGRGSTVRECRTAYSSAFWVALYFGSGDSRYFNDLLCAFWWYARHYLGANH